VKTCRGDKIVLLSKLMDYSNILRLRERGGSMKGRGEDNRISILYVQPYAAEINGVDVVLLSLVKGLDPNSFRVEAVFSGPSPYIRQYEELGVKVHYCKIPVFGKPKSLGYLLRNLVRILPALWQIRGIIRSQDIDILHVHKLEAFIVSLAGRWTGRSVIHTIHEVPGRPFFAYRMIARIAGTLADKVIVLCDASGSMFRSLQNKVKKIYNGIDFGDVRVGKYKSQSEIEQCVRILSVGRITPMKGQIVLLKAIKQLRDRGFNNLQVSIVGAPNTPRDRDYMRLVETYVRENGLETIVRFLGRRDDVQMLMVDADLFVLPSIYDVWPTTVLEAASCGVPIVATRVGGVPEMIGEFGTLIAPNDTVSLSDGIIRSLNDWPITCERARHCRERVRMRFSRKRYVEETSNLYLSLAKGPLEPSY
jgi:glycosyltransferase involved in cell wall biosynthesis